MDTAVSVWCCIKDEDSKEIQSFRARSVPLPRLNKPLTSNNTKCLKTFILWPGTSLQQIHNPGIRGPWFVFKSWKRHGVWKSISQIRKYFEKWSNISSVLEKSWKFLNVRNLDKWRQNLRGKNNEDIFICRILFNSIVMRLLIFASLLRLSASSRP